MSRYSRKQSASPETQEEALKTAKAMQRPGQTKEQTRLIAQGIQKGIEQYKKQNKAKSRELNRRLKTAPVVAGENDDSENLEPLPYRQHWLPWMLLLLSWLGAGLYLYFF